MSPLQSDKTIRALISASPIAIVAFDADSKVLLWNPAAERLFGWSEDEVLGRPLPYIQKEKREEHIGLRQRVLNGEDLINVEVTRQRKDGSSVVLAISTAPLREPDGRITGVISVNSDITEHRRREQALLESEERYRTLFDRMAQGVVHEDSVGCIISANPAAEQILGVKLEQLRGRRSSDPLWRIMREDGSPCPAADHPSAVALRTGAPVLGTVIGIFDPTVEEYRWVLFDAIPEYRPGETVPHQVFSTFTDITERKRAQDALDRNSYVLKESQRVARLGHYSLDFSVGLWDSSEMLNELFGIEPEYPRTVQGWLDLIHPRHRQEMLSYFEEEIVKANRDFDHEYQIIRKCDQNVRWVHGLGRIEFDESGTAVRMIGTIQDITEQKKAKETLAQERNLLHQITETSPIGIAVVSPQGRITFSNSFANRLLGLGEDRNDPIALTGPGWKITSLDGSAFPEHELPVNQVLRAGGPISGIRYELERPDGSRCLLSASAAPLRDESGRLTGVLALFEDITEQVRAEKERERVVEELRQSQKMEAVGRLAGGVAHDFNNMLAVIMSMTEMAIPEVEPESSLYHDLIEIDRAAQRSADLTRQLLAFSRKQIVQPRPVNLDALIHDEQKMLGRLIGEDIRIEVIVLPGLWNVWIDPSQIDQILANLLVNSRDAISGVGVITIKAGNTFLDESLAPEDMPIESGEYVLISVTDTGHGMDRETLQHVFEPFFTTKIPGTGTGLGLSTVYGIVKQNGGLISVDSSPGLGTTFNIYLPRHVGEVSEPPSSRSQTELSGKETILVVEDEEAILKLAKRFLERQGYRVLTARTPIEAIGVVHEHAEAIQLLLTDVVMPGMNGKQLESKLREVKPSIRTVFMSGYTADVIAQRGVLEEGIDFIQKPFTMRILTEKIREVLDR